MSNPSRNRTVSTFARSCSVGLAVALGVLTSAAPALAGTGARDDGKAPPKFVAMPGVREFSGRMIVRPKQPSPPPDSAARVRLAKDVARYYPEVDEYVVNLPAGENEDQYAARLLATGDYQYVHPDWLCFPVDTTPNDPRYPEQWHHSRIHSAQAWDITTGDPEFVLALVDTGIDLTHPDLAPHRVSGYNSASHLAEVDGGQVNDINGHGTHTSGDAAAIGNNATGVCGVGWNFNIMMVRATNSANGNANLADLMEGARWAVQAGAHVISCSYSGVENATVSTTGDFIHSHGGLYCYAAGNSASNLAGFDYPNVIIVGASDENDNRAGFSSYGHAVDVFAPGTNILSTINGGGYGTASGTSMATPITNGALSLIWSVSPGFSPDQVQQFLFDGCDDLGDPGDDDIYGHGRINVFRSVQLALGSLGPHAPFAIADSASILSGMTGTIDVLANDFDVNMDVITLTAFSPASSAGGTVERLTGAGPGGRDELLYNPPSPGYAGTDTFTYTISDPGSLTASTTVTVQVLDPSLFRQPDHPPYTAPGVGAAYYSIGGLSALPDFSVLTPFLTELVPAINFPPTDGNFAGSGLADNVAAVFQGYVSVPEPGVYTFFTSSDDGSRLLIGSQEVVNNDGLHGMQERSGQIGLQAGLHELRVEYFENGGSAGLIASIQGPTIPKQAIPAEALVHRSCPCDPNGNGLDSQDFFNFLLQFFAGNADFNDNGVTDSQDVFDFLTCFFSGC